MCSRSPDPMRSPFSSPTFAPAHPPARPPLRHWIRSLGAHRRLPYAGSRTQRTPQRRVVVEPTKYSPVSDSSLLLDCDLKKMKMRSDELEWLPGGSQLEMESSVQSGDKQRTYTSFSRCQKEITEKPLCAKYNDINIARLGPGQTIELEAHAVKGVGKVHAKWSPVATAWYRMLPEVVLLKEIKGDDAETLVKKCPVNVFDIEDLGNGEKRAAVVRPRACTLCRECIRKPTKNQERVEGTEDKDEDEDEDEAIEDQVEIRRVRDHFIFKIESTGALPPEVLFTEAVKVLEEKCEKVISELS